MRVAELLRYISLPAMAFFFMPGVQAQAEAVDVLFDQVAEKARSLAGKAYVPPDGAAVPEVLKKLSYDRFRDIRFDKRHALWGGEGLFSVEFFHLGFLYREPVRIHEVVEGRAQPITFDPRRFDYGKNAKLPSRLSPDLGFAGFRIHFPINNAEYRDEVIAFLGASYFRMVGRNQSYGLSARGLAIDTALPEGEEFPRFREFWLVRPARGDTTLRFYALLDSESVTGAYRFELTPGTQTVLDVRMRLFAREDVGRLGIAPLTSMFLHGQNRSRPFDDYRPQVHDSDGLLVETGADEWIWRPLSNGKHLRVSSLMDAGPKGFGLAQRERRFGDYQDLEARYETRPGKWVQAQGGDWGKGAVALVEIPSEEETVDNIVAFWMPEQPFKAGEQRNYGYRLQTFGSRLDGERLASVQGTRIGWGATPGVEKKPPRSLRQFIVDFSGEELNSLDASQPVEARLGTSSGEISDVTVKKLPDNLGWRVAFKLKPQGKDAADMRLHLNLQDRVLSETWSYVWYPEDLHQ